MTISYPIMKLLKEIAKDFLKKKKKKQLTTPSFSMTLSSTEQSEFDGVCSIAFDKSSPLPSFLCFSNTTNPEIYSINIIISKSHYKCNYYKVQRKVSLLLITN